MPSSIHEIRAQTETTPPVNSQNSRNALPNRQVNTEIDDKLAAMALQNGATDSELEAMLQSGVFTKSVRPDVDMDKIPQNEATKSSSFHPGVASSSKPNDSTPEVNKARTKPVEYISNDGKHQEKPRQNMPSPPSETTGRTGNNPPPPGSVLPSDSASVLSSMGDRLFRAADRRDPLQNVGPSTPRERTKGVTDVFTLV